MIIFLSPQSWIIIEFLSWISPSVSFTSWNRKNWTDHDDHILGMFFHSPADTKVSHINHFRGSTLIQALFFIDFCKRIDSQTEYSYRTQKGFHIQIWISNNVPVSIPPPYKLAPSDLSEIFSQDLKAGLAVEWSGLGSSHAISLQSKEPRYWKSIGKAVCVVTVVTGPPARTLQYQTNIL